MADYLQHPAPTGRLVDGDLVPDSATASVDTTVWLALPPEDDGIQRWEGLAAEIIDAQTVRLAAVPLFTYGVHFGDEMTVIASAEGPLVATGIGRRGHFRTFRLWLAPDQEANLTELIGRFAAMGCLIEGYSDSLLGIGCTIDQAPDIALALTSAARNGELIWEPGD